jgi:gliding motility-associated-like protein
MRHLILPFIVLMVAFQSRASHIVGGEMYYDYLGNNQYRIFINVFRDCLSSGADFDSPLPLGIFRASNNTSVQNIDVPYTGKTNVPVTFNNPCVIPPTNICTENSLYSTVVTLPPIPGGYRVAYVRCCRGPNINNLVNPDETGLTLTVNIPGIENNAYQNSSPRFLNYPPMLLCNNDALNFNHSATEPDGDQLVYSLATPFRGGTTTNPMPTPTPAPPYAPVTWAPGFSQGQPLGPGSTLAINNSTGMLTGLPNLTGRFVVGIRVDEYRNGTLISSTVRDFIFRVFNCNITMQAILPTQEQLPGFTGFCTDNLTIHFANNSYGGTNYKWDFGDPTTTSDVSNQFAPSYTYPDTGKYIATLVVNPGWPCTDTAHIEINLYKKLNSSIQFVDSLCFLNNNYEFNAVTDGPTGTTLSWNFGSSATPTSATGPQANTHFNSAGNKTVILTSKYKVCEAKDTVIAHVLPQPHAQIATPANYECDGLEVHFVNSTQNATNHFWDFGVNGATSNQQSPTYEFPAGGTYVVNYKAWSTAACVDSMQLTIHVNEKLEVSFTQSPDQCITGNSFDFVGTVAGPPHATYHYVFGSGVQPSTQQGSTLTGIHFDTPGTHSVTLVGQFDQCVKQAASTVFIYKEPTIGFGIEPGLQCEPFAAHFINYSSADSPMYYEWDFGDGFTSTEEHPIHVYTTAGNYPVTLKVLTEEGCIDTLYLSQVDLINVNPTPKAQFLVDKLETDICHPLIRFTNLSTDAATYHYFFDDGMAFSTATHPEHYYLTSGDHYVRLIAVSDKGCRDTTMQKIYVEPFSIFIPNTFTPDEDEFNPVFQAKMVLEPSEWNMTIYDRGGEIIFESNDYTATWDGTYKGQYVQTGLYHYIVRYKPCGNELNTVYTSGHVNVLR